jgi:hypothetical protein
MEEDEKYVDKLFEDDGVLLLDDWLAFKASPAVASCIQRVGTIIWCISFEPNICCV